MTMITMIMMITIIWYTFIPISRHFDRCYTSPFPFPYLIYITWRSPSIGWRFRTVPQKFPWLIMAIWPCKSHVPELDKKIVWARIPEKYGFKPELEQLLQVLSWEILGENLGNSCTVFELTHQNELKPWKIQFTKHPNAPWTPTTHIELRQSNNTIHDLSEFRKASCRLLLSFRGRVPKDKTSGIRDKSMQKWKLLASHNFPRNHQPSHLISSTVWINLLETLSLGACTFCMWNRKSLNGFPFVLQFGVNDLTWKSIPKRCGSL